MRLRPWNGRYFRPQILPSAIASVGTLSGWFFRDIMNPDFIDQQSSATCYRDSAWHDSRITQIDYLRAPFRRCNSIKWLANGRKIDLKGFDISWW